MGYVHHGFVWHIGKLRYFQMHLQFVGYGTTKCISALFYQSRWKHPNLLAKLSGCCYGNISCNELELYLDGAQNKRENKWTCVSMCVCVCVSLSGTRPWSSGTTVQKHQSSGTYQPHAELPQSMLQSRIHTYKHKHSPTDGMIFNVLNNWVKRSFCLCAVVCDSRADAGAHV